MQREKGKEPLREVVKRLDRRLWHQLERVWQLAEEGIQDAQKSTNGHQQGTPHCRALEENLGALIPDDWKGTRFTATDLFVLSAAAALHDAGKAGDLPDDHGHVSMWEVRSRAMTFGLDQGQAEVVGWIVRAHNDGDLGALPSKPVPLGTAEVNLRPLAAFFKLADVLHTDYRRISRQVVEFGGKRAEDNPKTRFRLRVRGWRFDDRGRIELYAVPKDWDDVAVIHTGFGMTRRELEPAVPTLQDTGFPWELTLRLDEADLERKAIEEVEAERRVERAFVGMDYFTEADAPHFKGRDDDAQALWRRVMAVPLTLLVGDSGVGKTSLIHAGLFPRLHQARWRTAYTRPFDDPDHFVVRDLWRDLLEGEPPADETIVDTLARVCRVLGDCRLLVVLDQFEDVVRLPLPEMLDGLRQALVAVQARRFRNLQLLVSYRADAEATLGPLFQEVAGSDRGVPRIYLQPLSRAGARAALEAGFAEAQVGVNDRLLDAIADELELQTPTTGVYSPYVQMVGETLCRAAREENESILTEELYRTRGGCEEIIGRYLLQRLAEFGEREEGARRVLVALVRSTGVKGQPSLEELQAETRLDAEPLTRLVGDLVGKRMIRHLGGEQYEIIHDHLAQLVDQVIVADEERQLKELREFLELRARAYVTSYIPLQTPDMARLYAVRERVSPNGDQMRLLLHSCLLGRGPAWFWLRGAPKAAYLPLLRDILACPFAKLRQVAALVVAQVAGRDEITDLQDMLKDEDQRIRQCAGQSLAQLLQQMGREAIPDLREMVRNEDQVVREAAVFSLAQVLPQMGRDAIPDLQRLLRVSTFLYARHAVSDALSQVMEQIGQETVLGLLDILNKKEVIPNLRELLRDREYYVRQSAVETLAEVAGQEATSDLREMLQDEHEYVRKTAVQELSRVAGREAIPDLRRVVLEDQDWSTRRLAAQSLARVLQTMGSQAIPDLREMLKDQDGFVRQTAAEALAQVLKRVGRGYIANLREMLKDQHREMRRVAAEALTQVLLQRGRESLPDLKEMLKDQHYEVRQVAVEALAQVAESEDIPDLQEMLEDQHWGVQQAARQALARVLKNMGWKAIPYLREWLKPKGVHARQAAIEALPVVLQQVRPETVPDLPELLREMLKEKLKDEKWYMRMEEAEALSQTFQEVGPTAIPSLRGLLRDGAVRGAAMHALKELVTEADLEWLTEWVVRYLLTETSEAANCLLIYLDRKLYCPFEWPEALRAQEVVDWIFSYSADWAEAEAEDVMFI